MSFNPISPTGRHILVTGADCRDDIGAHCRQRDRSFTCAAYQKAHAEILRQIVEEVRP